jgi:hypothetical protein
MILEAHFGAALGLLAHRVEDLEVLVPGDPPREPEAERSGREVPQLFDHTGNIPGSSRRFARARRPQNALELLGLLVDQSR